MLNNPKWIIFFFLFFGLAIIVGYMMNGIYAPNCATAFSPLDTIKGAFTYDYNWIEGNLQIFRWVMVSIQSIGVALIIYELASGFIGRR